MIKVNLLPQELRPVQRTPLPHIISLLVLVAALLFMGNVFFMLRGQLVDVNSQITKQKAELEELKDVVTEYNELTEQKKQLQDKIEIIQTILKERTIWSGHIHQLTTLTPENIWYKRIRLITRKFTEEVPAFNKRTGEPEMDPKTGKPKMNREQRDKFVLEVSGYAIDDATGLSSTSTLATNTSVDTDFSNTFTLITSKITDTEFNGYLVREFMFEYLVGSSV
jgi:hypothetical protein